MRGTGRRTGSLRRRTWMRSGTPLCPHSTSMLSEDFSLCCKKPRRWSHGGQSLSCSCCEKVSLLLHSWFYYSVCRCALSDILQEDFKRCVQIVLCISARPFVDICWCGSDVTGFWKSSSSFRKSGAFGFGSIVYYSVFILETQESASGTKQNLPSKEKSIFSFSYCFSCTQGCWSLSQGDGRCTDWISHQFIAGPHTKIHTHTHTCGQFRLTTLPNVHTFVLWKEVEVPKIELLGGQLKPIWTTHIVSYPWIIKAW